MIITISGLMGVLLISFLLPIAQAPPGTATLTIMVRDPTGAPLPGVTLALLRDTDAEGWHAHERGTTDAQGQFVYEGVPWGLYAVQFHGRTPDGRPLLPVDQQNRGLLHDGSGLDAGGFGLRIAEVDTMTQLFVIGSGGSDTAAVPMFDLATHPDQPPQPVEPLLDVMKPTPTPLMTMIPLSPLGDRPPPGTAWLLGALVLVALVLVVVLLVGRIRAAQAERKEAP